MQLQVAKIFDFNGLIIEVLKKAPENKSVDRKPVIVESSTQNEASRSSGNSEKHFVCEICRNFIAKDEEVVLKACKNTFCRVCLISAIIGIEGDVIKCPTKFSDCDCEIGNEEIKALIGEDNFEIFIINRLDKKLNSLVVRDEEDYQSM